MPGGRAACHVPNFTLVNVRLCTALPCLPTLLGLTLNPALHCLALPPNPLLGLTLNPALHCLALPPNPLLGLTLNPALHCLALPPNPLRPHSKPCSALPCPAS